MGGVGHLPVGGAGSDEAGDGLERAVAGAEFLGKPIEQLGVRWLLTTAAEVAGGIDDAAPEMPLPETIDDHTVG